MQGVLSTSHALVVPIGRLKRLNAIIASPCFLSNAFLRGLQAVINTHGGCSMLIPLLKQKISFELSPQRLWSRSKWGHCMMQPSCCRQAIEMVCQLETEKRYENCSSQAAKASTRVTYPRCWETCGRAWGSPPSWRCGGMTGWCTKSFFIGCPIYLSTRKEELEVSDLVHFAPLINLCSLCEGQEGTHKRGSATTEAGEIWVLTKIIPDELSKMSKKSRIEGGRIHPGAPWKLLSPFT